VLCVCARVLWGGGDNDCVCMYACMCVCGCKCLSPTPSPAVLLYVYKYVCVCFNIRVIVFRMCVFLWFCPCVCLVRSNMCVMTPSLSHLFPPVHPSASQTPDLSTHSPLLPFLSFTSFPSLYFTSLDKQPTHPLLLSLPTSLPLVTLLYLTPVPLAP
jgi:hypothetical protein